MNPLRLLLSGLTLAVVLLSSSACGGNDDEKDKDSEKGTTSSQEQSPDAVDTLLDTGREQTEAGDYEAARGTFESVLTLDPENAYAHYNLGVIAQRDGQSGEARREYAAALELQPDLAPALYNLGILTEPRDLDEAVELFQRAVEADPKFAAAHMRLGFAQVHLGETAEGEEHLAQGLELDPSLSEVETPSYR